MVDRRREDKETQKERTRETKFSPVCLSFPVHRRNEPNPRGVLAFITQYPPVARICAVAMYGWCSMCEMDRPP